MLQLPAWAARHPWLSAAGSLLVLGAAIGWFANGLPSPSTARTERDAWQIPGKNSIDRYDPARFQQLTSSKAWAPKQNAALGSHGSKGNGNHEDSWRLVGIITTSGPFALIVPKGASEPERLPVGAKVPGGAVIKKIDKDAIVISTAHCTQHLSLFPPPKGNADHQCSSDTTTNKEHASVGDSHD